MTERHFLCSQCGNCCNRIVITKDTGKVLGMCLMLGEEKLFDGFSDAVLPYFALQKPGLSQKQIVAYQMVQEPCPLYDAATKTCMVYAQRPTICRAYPFELSHGGYSVERTCTWAKAERCSADYMGSIIRVGTDQEVGVLAMDNFFRGLRGRMRRTGYTRFLVFDAKSREWSVYGDG